MTEVEVEGFTIIYEAFINQDIKFSFVRVLRSSSNWLGVTSPGPCIASWIDIKGTNLVELSWKRFLLSKIWVKSDQATLD